MLLLQKIPWGVWAVILAIIAQTTILRTGGGYNYRKFIYGICLILLSIFGSGIIIVTNLSRKNPFSSMYVSKFFSTLCYYFLGLDAVVEGRENMLEPDQPAIYMYNHQSMLDLHFMSFSPPKQGSAIVKKSLKYYPFFGQFLMLFNCIFIDRGNHKNAVIQARQAADEILRKKTSIYAFPEGTRSGVQNVDLLPFKKGLFHMATQAKVPIVPIVIGNYKHLYNPEKRYILRSWQFLPPVWTQNIPEDAESVAELVDGVRGQMLATLKEISQYNDEGKYID